MKRPVLGTMLVCCALVVAFRLLHSSAEKSGGLALPSSKLVLEPVPGSPQPTNSFPTAMALSPDGKYLALLNDGYGTFESEYRQSIAVLDIANNALSDFPDTRLERHARQTYFYGLAFSVDGKKLYASMSSMTDSSAQMSGSTGSGVAIYGFSQGKLKQDGFIRFPASKRPAEPKTAQPDPDEAPSTGSAFTIPY